MKKSIIFLLLVIGFTIFPRLTRAEANYQNFQEINLAEGKMLERYTDKEYQDYYKKVDKRKFWGWRVHYVHRNIETSYISFLSIISIKIAQKGYHSNEWYPEI